MTLDDENAARIAREVVDGGKATRVYLHPKDLALVRAGYAARDAEVEELRARLARVRAVYDAWFLHEATEWVDLLLSDISDALDESPTERETPADEWEYRIINMSQGFESEASDSMKEVESWFEEPDDVIERRRKAGPWEVVPDDRA